MRVLITGASGGIGRALGAHLREQGHEVASLRRVTGDAPIDASMGPAWDPARGILDVGVLSGVDAVVHLSGANIGDGRWTDARRHELRASRVDSTRLLVDRMRDAVTAGGPRVLVCASAVGYYGDTGEAVIDETAPHGEGFLADLVEAWEREAARATEFGVRVVSPRFGVVMAADDGALRRMALATKLGAGGPLGSGRQWMSWVAPRDLVRGIEWFLTHGDASGVYNLCSPEPARNGDIARALGRVLHRPALLPTPAFALRLLLGRAADELVLASQRVVPRRLLDAGFVFELPGIEDALRAALRPGDRQHDQSRAMAS